MLRAIMIFVVTAGACVLMWQSLGHVYGDGSGVLVIEVDGVIDPLTADHVARGIDQAEKDGASLVVIRLDTPGGVLESTRDIVRSILESQTPVAVYVSPAGARAASAGAFVAAAANFAVMTPGSTIGAASPVASDGSDLTGTVGRKISEDTQAFIRSIAQARGRNHEALEDTVTKAASYSAQEALDLGIIDLIAANMPTMLDRLDERTAKTSAGESVVSSAGVEARELSRTFMEYTLGILARPNVVLLLFIIGGLCLVAEAAVPGMFGPGIAGAIALALALVGFMNLPGSWVGVALIALSMGLFYGETTSPGFGVFGAGGIACLIVGSLLLFGNFFSPSDLPSPSFMISPIMIVMTTGLATAAWVMFMRAARSEGGTSSGFQTDEEAFLEGQWGVALSDMQPSGKVWVSNKEWSASTSPGGSIKEGDEVRVVGVYGEVLKVEKLYEDSEMSR